MNRFSSTSSPYCVVDELNCETPKNDVFINYSFEDIGKSFISHLQAALSRNSFTICDHMTRHSVGQDVSSQLLEAIEESEIFILVFSIKYACSIRCLDELVVITDFVCRHDKRKVLPVFFKVEPSHVASQKGPFMEAFNAYETNLDTGRVQKWKQALNKAGRVSGLTLQHGDEAEFIMEIVKEVKKMQNPQELHVTDHPVGIRARAEELISKLRLDSKDVLVVAVIGFSGIGKTTIVKATYNRIAAGFDVSCFLADMYYHFGRHNWKVKLQKELISYLTQNDKHLITYSHNDGLTKIRKLVRHRKLLLVLDDVHTFQQLEALGINPNWFYTGSRIIVTTRDKRSLGNIPYISYHMMLLNRRESLDLFIQPLFARDDRIDREFVDKVVDHAGGLPLVLKVWSQHFKQYETGQWASMLETLKRIPHGDVQQQLQMSYDALTSYRSKQLFLDIACFFDGMDKDFVIKVLQKEDKAFFPDNEIQYLADKSLVEITGSDSKLQMHHAIREMGREIVRQENEDEPGRRSRLWDEKEVIDTLTECSGTESVESIIQEGDDYELNEVVTVETFRKMSNLRLIKLNGLGATWVNFDHDEMTPQSFKKLKYMDWEWFPFKKLDIFDMRNVVVLRLEHSDLETLWEGFKSLKKLRILDVSGSSSLTKTGDFYGLENLEELDLSCCFNLIDLHSSIGCLHKLAILDLRVCIPLKWIPWEMIAKLQSLRELLLKDCEFSSYGSDPFLYFDRSTDPFWLKHLEKNEFPSKPDYLLSLHELKKISLSECSSIQSIPDLPPSVTHIDAFECENLVNLPSNMSELKSLEVLDIRFCPKLGSEDPHFLMNVTGLMNLHDLYMRNCRVSQVPTGIGNLVSLKRLHLSACTFSSLPDSFCNLSQLVYLNINYCVQLRLLPLLPPKLTDIKAYGCWSLDVMPFDLMQTTRNFHTKECKESPFSSRLVIRFSLKKITGLLCYQDWQISFYTPKYLDKKVCGMIVGLHTTLKYDGPFHLTPKMFNITKNTSHHPKDISCRKGSICFMFYPLDATTLVVEPGDTVVLEFLHNLVSNCVIRLIYDNGMVLYPPTYGRIYKKPLFFRWNEEEIRKANADAPRDVTWMYIDNMLDIFNIPKVEEWEKGVAEL